MADDPYDDGGGDRRRINMRAPYEVREWANRLRVSRAELEEAVALVGNEVAELEKHFRIGAPARGRLQ